MEYKTSDGWDLDKIDPLHDAIEAYNNMSNDIYELNNCKRTQSLVETRDSLIEQVEAMKEALEDIGDEDSVVEEEDN